MTRHYLVGGVAYPATNAPAVRDGRPVLVIDPEDRKQVERLYDNYDNQPVHFEDLSNPREGEVAALQASLRSLLGPEKPAEPTGLGAVVEDEAGVKWVRHDSTPISRPWLNTDDCETRYRLYDELAVVKVLSEGVTA